MTYDGDPGTGVWLVPIGAALMFYGVIGFARGFNQAVAGRQRKGKERK
jgi:hypothetical protein